MCMSAPPVQMAPPPPPPVLPLPPPPPPTPTVAAVQSGVAPAEGSSGARLTKPEEQSAQKQKKNRLRTDGSDVATGLNIPR
jgi:hypothetical protein